MFAEIQYCVCVCVINTHFDLLSHTKEAHFSFFVSDARQKVNVDLKFALPGKERQDSVFSGLQVHSHLS